MKIVEGNFEQAVRPEQHAESNKHQQHGDAKPAGKPAGGDADKQNCRADKQK